jgi:hypothetical protein
LTTHNTPWSGNFVPIYHFVGYVYGAGVIPLSTSPGPGLLGRSNFAGTANCLEPSDAFPAECLGAMGLLTDGSPCCPAGLRHVCCIDGECMLMNDDMECLGLGGIWHPEWDSCAPNPCAPPEAVCCVAEVCHIVTEAGCASLGGVWHGDWDSCVPNPCEGGTPAETATWGFIKALFR